jgi:TonB family protein
VNESRIVTCCCFAILIADLAATQFLRAQNSQQFPQQPSAGAAIQHAAIAAVNDRRKFGPVDVISDTRGVNFGPYVDNLIPKVRKNWYAHIPSNAQPIRGRLRIQFSILKDGSIGAMTTEEKSGDKRLDQAAWEGITTAAPFAPLPPDFTGNELKLRFNFYYNLSEAEIAANSTSGANGALHAALIGNIPEMSPKYPDKALQSKIEGVVRLEAEIQPDGTLAKVNVMEGDATLADASATAIRKWRFYPARKDGTPVEEVVRIRVDFHLAGQRVQVQVVAPQSTKPPHLEQ